jgi:hypothetical protein
MKENLSLLFIKYLVAEIELDRSYASSGETHPDNCECNLCQDIKKWQELSFFQRLIAKIFL